MIVVVLVVALAVLQLLDWYSTRTIIARGGREQNPVMARAFEQFGIDATLAVKAVAVVGIGWLVGNEAIELLLGIVGVYMVVVAHNWRSMP